MKEKLSITDEGTLLFRFSKLITRGAPISFFNKCIWLRYHMTNVVFVDWNIHKEEKRISNNLYLSLSKLRQVLWSVKFPLEYKQLSSIHDVLPLLFVLAIFYMNKEAAPFSQWRDPDWSAICYNINSRPHWQASLLSALSCIFGVCTICEAIDVIIIHSEHKVMLWWSLKVIPIYLVIFMHPRSVFFAPNFQRFKSWVLFLTVAHEVFFLSL